MLKKGLLLSALLAMIFPLVLGAQTHPERETFDFVSNGVTYKIYVISNTDMTASVYNYTDRAVTGATGAVTIPSTAEGYTIIALGRGAFYNCSDLTEVTVPETVTTIGEGAFENCSSLTKVNLPQGVKTMDYGVFTGCAALEAIDLSNLTQLTELGSYTFDSCKKLASITLPPNLSKIPTGLCYGCEALKHITLPTTIKSIGNSAFSNCYLLEEIVIPEGCTSIGTNAFTMCGYDNQRVYDSSWDEYDGGFEVTLPSTISSIGDGAFSGSPIMKVTSAIREPFAVNCFRSRVEASGFKVNLYVATGCQAKYEAATGWNIFDEIIEIEMEEGMDVSTPLADILSDGTNGESYQVREELLVYDQFSTYTTNLLNQARVYTYHILATDGNGNNIRLQIPQAKYIDLDGVYSLSAKSVSGTLRDKTTYPWLEVTSTPSEGDSDEPAPMENITVSQISNKKTYEAFHVTAFLNKDGKLYANKNATGTGYTPNTTYLPDVTLIQGYTYNFKAFKQGSTLYVYAAEQADVEPVDFSTTLANVLANGVNSQAYLLSDQLYVTYVASVSVGSGFVSTPYAQAYCTDGNGNWIAVRFPYSQFTVLKGLKTLAPRSFNGTLNDKTTNPYLNVTTNAVAGDETEFTDFRTINLKEKFEVKPCEVFLTTAYYASTNVNCFVPEYLGSEARTDADYASVGVFEHGTSPFNNRLPFTYGKCYDIKAVMRLQAAWGAPASPFTPSYTLDSPNWYKNLRLLPIESSEHNFAANITLSAQPGEYDEIVIVKVGVEDVPYGAQVVYTLTPAEETGETAPKRLREGDLPYDDEQGIVINKSATLTVSVLDAQDNVLNSVSGEYYINDSSTGLTTVTAASPADNVYYNLAGQRLSGRPTQPGIYINNGRKVVIK